MTPPRRSPKLSTTLFALTNEWLSRRYTFEQLVGRTAELGLGPGLEVVGFQSIRGYPRISREFEQTFKRLIDEHGLEPSALGANIDLARRADRLMTRDEVVETLEAQVEAARVLGFPVVRAQKLDDDLYEWAAARAEQAGVKLGIEIHAPLFVDHPMVLGLREIFDRIDSPALGFIPDWSATMTALPAGQLRAFEHNGLTRAQTDFLRELWERGGPPNELFEEFAERARGEGATPAAVGQVRIIFSMFARNDPKRWLEIMPRVINVHAKFYELEEDGTDASVPHAELVSVLKEGGYDGFVSSEWEAHAWADLDDADGFEMVRRHQELYRRLLAQNEPVAVAAESG
jgi:xylose isomerase-like TIM barrel protein